MSDHDETEDKHSLNRDDMRELFDEYLPKPSHIADKPRFFISYARDDGEAYAKDLRARLIPIFGEKAIWRDREGIIAHNEAGWWKQITEALDNVEYMLLIASPKAMVSDNVRKEIRYARSKGVTVCPILLPDKHHHPDFDNLPVGISQKHFYDLTHQWETLIKQLQTHGIGTKTPFSAPDMTKNFVQRPDIFNALKGYLLAQSEADATKNPVTISTALKGAGGFGKTVMATALAHDEAIQTAYLDGIVWVELGETPDMLFAMNTLYNQISPKAGSFSDMTTATKAVKDLMTGKNILLIVDDVWKAYHMQPFLEGNPTGATLVTTRYVDVVIAAHADLHRVDVDEMKPAEAVQLLMSNIAHQATPAVTTLAGRLGNWALMMTLANAMLRKRLQRQGATFADAVAWVNDELDEEGIISITSEQVAEVRHQSAGKAIEISFRTVDEDKRDQSRTRYLQLGIFPEGASIPISALYRLWGCTEHRAEKYAEQLDDLSLVKYNVSTQTLTLHDVVWKYAKEVLGDDARANHQRLIDGYGDLHALPDEYAWRNIGYHLIGANQPKQLRGLLLTYGWLDKKLHATDTNALLGDCALLLKQGKDEPIRLIQSAMSMSAHVLDKDKKALAHQLAGRLMHHYTKVDEIRAFLDSITPPKNSLFPINNGYDALNPAGGMLLRTMKHEGHVYGAMELTDGRILSWSRDKMRLWQSDGTPIATLIEHTDTVVGALQLPDGRLLSRSDNNTLHLWDADWSSITVITGYMKGIFGYMKLSDGRTLWWTRKDNILGVSTDNTLHLMNVDGAKSHMAGHTDGVNGVMELTDGRILSWSSDMTLRLWDVDGSFIMALTGHTDGVNGVMELADGRILSWTGDIYGESTDNTLRLWDVDGSFIKVLTGHTNGVNGAVQLADGRLLSWSSDMTLRLWDADGSFIKVLTGHTNGVNGAVQLADGRLLSWSEDRTLRLWDRDGSFITALTGHTDGIYNAVQLADGKLLSRSNDDTLCLWQPDGTPIATMTWHTGSVDSTVQLANGRLLSWEGTTLCLWDADGLEIATLTEHTAGVTGAMELSDGRILSWSEDRTLRLWNADGTPKTALTGHTDWVYNTIQLGDGRILSWSNDTTLHLWNADGSFITALTGHTEYVHGAIQLGDGRLLSWSNDTTLRLWNADGLFITVLTGHTEYVHGAIQLGDGRLLSWSNDTTLRLWDTDGSLITVLTGHMGGVWGAIELGDGRILSWGEDRTLRVWDRKGSFITALIGHTDGVTGAEELSDGRILSWAGSKYIDNKSNDNTLRLWDRDGSFITALTGHTDGVYGAVQLTDARLLSWSHDATLRLWDRDGTPIDLLEQYDRRGNSHLISIWAEKHGLILDDIYPDEKLNPFMAVRMRSQDTDLIIYDSKTGATITIFYGDAPFTMYPVMLDGGQVLVLGDSVGRVLFLRWVGEDGASNE